MAHIFSANQHAWDLVLATKRDKQTNLDTYLMVTFEVPMMAWGMSKDHIDIYLRLAAQQDADWDNQEIHPRRSTILAPLAWPKSKLPTNWLHTIHIKDAGNYDFDGIDDIAAALTSEQVGPTAAGLLVRRMFMHLYWNDSVFRTKIDAAPDKILGKKQQSSDEMARIRVTRRIKTGEMEEPVWTAPGAAAPTAAPTADSAEA